MIVVSRRTLAAYAVVCVWCWSWLTPHWGLISVGATESDKPDNRGEPPTPTPLHDAVPNSSASASATTARCSEGDTLMREENSNDMPGVVVQLEGGGDLASRELREPEERRLAREQDEQHLAHQQELTWAAIRETVSKINARLDATDDAMEDLHQEGTNSDTHVTHPATDPTSDHDPSKVGTQPALPPTSEHDRRRSSFDEPLATVPAPLQTTNDHLHASAEAIKETIRSEQKASTGTPLLLDHPQSRETLPIKKDALNSYGNDDNQDDEDDDCDGSGATSSEDPPAGVTLGDVVESNVAENEEFYDIPHDDIDDRTLLDIFGESAKEYLTQRVIPETDVDCLWDWRSLRCEPSCQCTFTFKSGDYHLGRSCRKRLEPLEICEPTVFIQDKPIPKRILSLIRQTADIAKDNVKLTAHNVVQTSTRRYLQLQEHVCLDLRSRLHKNPATGLSCWSSFPETTTLLEKLLCGQVEGLLCEDVSRQTTNAPIVASAAERGRRSDKIFGDFYEKDI